MNKRLKKKKSIGTIDWGDGSRKTYIVREKTIQSHYYMERGDYVIKITRKDGESDGET